MRRDAVLTTHALTSALHGKLHASPTGLGEVLSATPPGIVAWVEAVRDPSHRTAWAALGAWSGAVVLHGTLSAALNGRAEHSEVNELYPDPDEAMLEVIRTQVATVCAEPYRDDWGALFSAYAPVRDSQGQRHAGLQCAHHRFGQVHHVVSARPRVAFQRH